MTTTRAWHWFATALRLILAGVLGVAGAIKLPDRDESVRAVRAYQLLPEAIVPAVGYGLQVAVTLAALTASSAAFAVVSAVNAA